ncbi:MAG: enoyl-CoA hydratase/isomerase family protein, partial [Planktomarina sp.]|nr:enoyl-CoA hydratase/isomerase family protein [Planktomarina sp.]
MSAQVTLSKVRSIAVIEVNNPPVNALGHAVRKGLWDSIEAAEADNTVKAIVVIGAGRTFPAGADIKEFGTVMQKPHLPEVIDRIENCKKPVVAALHGTALGGGFEVALGSHYRIASADARIGLPEVNLGLLPGAGGTQRMPRLCGAKLALDVMLSGKPIAATKAHTAGLIDRLTEDDLRVAAIKFAEDVQEVRRSRDETKCMLNAEAYRDAVAEAKKMVSTRMRGQLAPTKILECVTSALEKPFAEGRAFERASFFECLS